MAGDLLGELLIKVGLDNTEFDRGMTAVGAKLQQTARFGQYTNLPILRAGDPRQIAAAQATTAAVSRVVSAAAHADAALQERVAQGAAKSLLKATFPLAHLPTPKLSYGLPFIVGATGAALFATAVKGAFERVFALKDAIADLRAETGLSTEGVSKMAAQARTFGVDASALAAGIKGMAVGVQTEAPAFAALGVALVDASGKAAAGGADLRRGARRDQPDPGPGAPGRGGAADLWRLGHGAAAAAASPGRRARCELRRIQARDGRDRGNRARGGAARAHRRAGQGRLEELHRLARVGARRQGRGPGEQPRGVQPSAARPRRRSPSAASSA